MKKIGIIAVNKAGKFNELILRANDYLKSIGNVDILSISNEEIDNLLNNNLAENEDFIKQVEIYDWIIFDNQSQILDLACLVSEKLNIEIFNHVITLDKSKFECQTFSGKATTTYPSEQQLIFILSKSFKSSLINDSKIEVPIAHQNFSLSYLNTKGEVISVENINNLISLADAKIVVGAGRGLKDPSNWGIIEELANKTGAALACSKPVSDLNWRPHHEHVGQTGIKISPKLYIACGISGAIQHLAGVNGSEIIVVINSDPDAPFVKNADYAIVGDVFQVVPELLKYIK